MSSKLSFMRCQWITARNNLYYILFYTREYCICPVFGIKDNRCHCSINSIEETVPSVEISISISKSVTNKMHLCPSLIECDAVVSL